MKNRAINIAVRVIGYLAAMAMSVFFALYMSAGAGWTFFYILAAAPFFSFAVTAATALIKCVEVTSDVSSTMVYKNEEVNLKVTVRNKWFFPIPSAVVKVIRCEGFSTAENNLLYCISVAPKSKTEVSVVFKAEMWGAAEIGVESVSLSDFLHFINIPLYKEKGEKRYIRTVKVFPDIPDIPSDTPLIKNTAEAIRFADDSEDTKETDSFSFFGGMPGYTHREYTEGDPIKRINWKLSSKRDIYMVRLDDETEAMQQIIVLDSRGGSRKDNEKAVEGLLAVVFSLCRLGLGSTVWYNSKDGFISAEITDQGDVAALQTAFADYVFTADISAVRIPCGELSEKAQTGGIMFFTPYADMRLAAEIEDAAGSGIEVTAVTPSANPALSSPFWIMNDDYTAELV